MDASTSGWGEATGDPHGDSMLPCSSAFVVPGQEDFYLESRGPDGHLAPYEGHGAEGSPGQHLGSTWPVPNAAAFHPGQSQVLQPPSPQPSLSPGHYSSPPQHAAYTYPTQTSPHQHSHLAALDLAATGAGSPPLRRVGGPGGFQGDAQNFSPSASPQFYGHAGQGGYGYPSLANDAWGQYGQRQQARVTQSLDTRFVAAAAYSSPPPFGGPQPASSPARPLHQQHAHPQQHPYQQEGRASYAEPYLAFPAAAPQQPYYQQHAQQAAGDKHTAMHATAARDGGERSNWGPGREAAVGALQGTLTSRPQASAQSPHEDASPSINLAGEGLYGGGPVRHVVDELRTSPLAPGTSQTPAGRGGGGEGSGGGGSGGGGKGGVQQRYEAQILALERHNAELQRRVADLQAALEAAQQARQALEAKQDALRDQAAEANSSTKARESSLESARRANDALSGELRGCQEALAAARDSLAEAKDTAVQWQDRAMEAGKELDAARRKIDSFGEEERRLSAENVGLRKELQQLNDGVIKGRIEASELREKLRQAQQDGARASSAVHAMASRAESEQESAAVQLVLMRNRVAELEARNSQMVFDLASSREEAARARQQAEAVKAALAAKPAGIISDAGPSARPYGSMAPAWLNSGAGTGGGSGGGGGEPAWALLPPPAPQHASGSAGVGAAGARGAAAVMRELPRDVAFSQLDPDTFRSMVRAEAEALARGGGGGGGGGSDGYKNDATPSSPQYRSYSGGQFGAGAPDPLAAEPSRSSVNAGLPPPSPHSRWAAAPAPSYDSKPAYDSKPYESRAYDGKPYGDVRDSLQALLPDPRASYVGPLADTRGVGAAGGCGDGGADTAAYSRQPNAQRPPSGNNVNARSSSPPPPYATYTADNSYAFRRPHNAVGTGAASAVGGSPFGTEDTSKDLLSRSKALEDQLMVLCSEKGGLEAEYARMPLGAGRSLRERNRKAVVEQRLELLNKEISAVRMQLKRVGVR